MQGLKRRATYITLYEVLAIAIASSAMILMGHSVADSTSGTVLISAIAIIWNLLWNNLFEAWEARQHDRTRTLKRRVLHAVGFEGGLVMATVPILAWILNISLLQALTLDIGLVLFFLVYTFVFNLAFDKVFGLPLSALPAREASFQ